jgi:membrane protease YdiL (CAAX protease family)
MIGPFLVVGVAIQAIAWRIVVLRRATFWPSVIVVWAILGVVALAIGDPRCCVERGVAVASAVGAASGLLLYGATRVVVSLASRWPVVTASVEDTYSRSGETSPVVAWVTTLAVVVPGEELFWRGVATPWLVDATATVSGAALAWLAAVAVASVWASLPFLAAAVVGGALWTALAVWSGGVAAPIASHLMWTACMIAWPPAGARAKVAG